ncbi:metallophosphoesterase [Virgibacillus sp. LDC-1]|uniref:metallophosphoesterase n=1 Tax=Virgibacillus sp. LDC-1 TaxID=3039856 RepID=UPI0024DEF2CC|nr:metallophosphoesterase [Virgibacillus sp. LDC-1]
MKIGVISDLHIDKNRVLESSSENILTVLVEKIKESKIDILLIPGDVSNDYRLTLHFLTSLEESTEVKVLFVPGNHDYWSKDNHVTDTWKVYESLKQWDGCIAENPYVLNEEWVVVGNSGWYDHSFGSRKFNNEQFNQMKYNGRTWKDSVYTNWNLDNKAVHEFFYEKLKQDLEAYKNKNIIMMTHMVTHPNFIVPMPHEVWDYFNAFLGSDSYHRLFEDYNIQYSIMGHVHFRKTDTSNHTKMICACLGNYAEWESVSIRKEINEAFYTFNIE